MKLLKCEQGSDEWFEARKGRMTASHAQQIGNCGKGLETYILDMMSEVYSSADRVQFSNVHTDRGNEYEGTARSLYELESGNEVKEVGFIIYDDYVGCSPDGLIGKDGGLEIKSVDDKKYFRHLLNGEKEIDSAHEWQVQMNLLITKRKWWDLVIYNPNYKERAICVYRIVPSEIHFTALREGFEVGAAKIKSIRAKLEKNV